jgi:hypothetical protein
MNYPREGYIIRLDGHELYDGIYGDYHVAMGAMIRWIQEYKHLEFFLHKIDERHKHWVITDKHYLACNMQFLDTLEMNRAIISIPYDGYDEENPYIN